MESTRHFFAACWSMLGLTGVALAAETTTDPQLLAESEPERFFIILILFALLGGGARLLVQWKTDVPWPQRLGRLLLAVFAAAVVALYLWGTVRPTVNMATAGMFAWLGGDAIDWVARVVLSRQFGSPMPPTGKDGV